MNLFKKASVSNRENFSTLGATTIVVIAIASLALVFANSTFWADSYITKAKNAGLMTGYTATEFGADDPMTVAQFAVVTVNGALDGKTVTTNVDYWAMDYLVTSLQKCFYDEFFGSEYLIYGVKENWADEPVTREEASFILANVLRKQGATLPTAAEAVTILSQFDDVNASTYAKTEFGYGVAVMVDSGIMKGSTLNGKNIFNPEGNMTRAEVCVIITNLLDQGVFKSYSSSNSTTTTPSSGTTGTTTTTPSTGTTTTTPSTGTTTTTPSTESTTTTTTKPTNVAGTEPVIGTAHLGSIAYYPDDVVAGSGQYNVNVYTVPADTNKDGWITYREVMTVWEKIYAEYPYGMTWTNDNAYTSNVYWTGSVGVTNKGVGCAAFAWMCSDMIFGNLPVRRVTATADQDPLEVIRPGDVYWGKAIQHWGFAIGTAYMEGYPALENNISMGSGNSNGEVRYGSFNNTYVSTRDSIASLNSIFYTRYPAV